jgi:hypothetical protein
MKDNPPFKTERQQIQQELSEADEDSVADADMKAAKKLEFKLGKVYSTVNDSVKLIIKNISDFNAPGLKAAFLDGLKVGIKGGQFDVRAAQKRFEKYFKGR